jgi:hypothetical protein
MKISNKAHTATPIPASTRRRAPTAVAAAALVLFATAGAAPAAAEQLTWKPAQLAMLRVNDAPPKEWDVFQIEKKDDRFVVQLAERFLLLDAVQRQVFELDPAAIERQGSDLLWDPERRPEKPLATSDWVLRDVGTAFRIRVRLDEEGRALDLQFPHPSSRP